MSGNVVNLRTARKKKKRLDKEAKAEQNRIQFGRTKTEKEATKILNEREASRIDQKKLED